MNENKLSIALFSSAIILISSISLYYKFKNDELESKYNDLEKKYEKEKALRHEERSSRIALQQRSREDLLKASKSFGFNYIPIGYIESPFKDRRGTPRQPRLVPGSKGRIRLDKRAVQYEHFAELSSFSHIWILFVFHQNTNLDKSITKKTQNNEETDLAQEIEKDKQQEVDNENPLNYFKKVPAKIKPPRLHGKKVGCLTTRSPHRPNNIGLSVCEVVSVGQDYIEVKGIDMVDGTPVIDVKPYIPYDVVPSDYELIMAKSSSGENLPQRKLEVPSWIVETDIPMLPVQFSSDVIEKLDDYFERNKKIKNNKSNFFNNTLEAIEFITQVLRQDIRGVHQGRGETQETLYNCRLASFSLSFITKEEGIFVKLLEIEE